MLYFQVLFYFGPLPTCLQQTSNEMTGIDPELPWSEDGDKEETGG
jgi:hypothetical protein